MTETKTPGETLLLYLDRGIRVAHTPTHTTARIYAHVEQGF